MKPLLTIGYPTYGRRESIEAAVAAALEAIDGLPVELLVADNCSPDGTAEQLRERFAQTSLRLIVGSENLGWKGNIARLAEHATAKYLLLLSDEDDVAGSEPLRELLQFLSETPDVAFVTTGDGYLPTDPNALQAVDVWEGVHYISGNIFRTSELSKWLSFLDDLHRTHDIAELWEIYPHYMIVAGIWLSGKKCAHFRRNVYVYSRRLPMRWKPSHRQPGDRELVRTRQEVLGKAYLKSISSNILQHASLSTLLDVLQALGEAEPSRLAQMRRWQSDRIAKQIDGGIAYLYPELYPAWREGIRRRYAFRHRVIAGLRHLVRRLTRRPVVVPSLATSSVETVTTSTR